MKKFYASEKEKNDSLREIDSRISEKLGEIDEMNNKTRSSKLAMYISLAISLVFMIIYFISTIINSFNSSRQIEMIIGVIIISIFTVLFIYNSLKLDHKKLRIPVIISSILLSIYYLFLFLTQNNFLVFPKQSTVLNFYKKDITEVVNWAEKNSILVEQVYENSDIFKQYQVISQSVEAGTLTKKIKKITVVVSDGPSIEKETTIPDMIGWDIDEVIKFVDDNFLTNLTINFDFSDNIQKDTVYEQKNESTKMLRNSAINLKVSLGKKDELDSVAMKNLIGMDTFHATTWLGRNAINYEIRYGYSDKYDEGTVIKQSITKGKIINKGRTQTVVITIAKKDKITVPDFKDMTQTEIVSWATENQLKINFTEENDDTIEEGKVIRSSKLKGDTVTVGDTIKVVISKGQIKMINFTDIDSFRTWADNNLVSYHIDYQFNSSVKAGELISSSHEVNQVIKNNETVNLVISQGGTTTVPDFIGKTKEEATALCSQSSLKCKFNTSDNSNGNTVIKQSMRKDSTVPVQTSIELTIQ